MRWLASWALYWIGHVSYLLGDQVGLWPGHFWYSAYQYFMRLSVETQRAHGPWDRVSDSAVMAGPHCAEIEPE